MERGRQSKRISQRRQAEAGPPSWQELQYARERVSDEEARRARFMMVVAGLVFLGACVAYGLLAAGEILG